jgi:hypothetical protein
MLPRPDVDGWTASADGDAVEFAIFQREIMDVSQVRRLAIVVRHIEAVIDEESLAIRE